MALSALVPFGKRRKVQAVRDTPEGLFREVFVQPVLRERAALGRIAITLLILSAAQGLFLLLVGPFLKALFADVTASGLVPLATIVPESLVSLWPWLAETSLPRHQLTIAVPLFMVIAGCIQAAATYSYQWQQSRLALKVAKEYREELFGAVLRKSYQDLEQAAAGRWMSLIMNDVLYLQNRFSDILASFVRDGVLIIACFMVIVVIHWPTALILAVLTPIVMGGMGKTGGRIASYTEEMQQHLGKIAAAVLDIRRRFSFIRAQHGEKREEERFATMNNAYYRAIRRSLFVRSAFAPAVEFLGFAVFAAFIYLAGKSWFISGFRAAELIQFFAALGLLLRPLRNIGEQLGRFQETKGSLLQSFKVVMEDREALQKTGRTPLPSSLTTPIQIEKVNVTYGEKSAFLTTNIDLVPATSIALVGPSGAGKTSFLRTLAGLIEPKVWVSNNAQDALRPHSALVSQNPFLFSDTIRANLEYGLEQKPTEEQLWLALEQASVADVIRGMPQGLNTPIRAIEGSVSGGQLQRLVIARAILRNAKLWLFDEATSALDAKSEREIMTQMLDMCRKQGLIFVAITHRTAMLPHFDEVWLIEKGRLIARGNHATMQNNDRYRQFTQFHQ